MKEKYLLLTMVLSVFLILFFTTSLALIPGDFGSEGGGPPDGCVDFEDLMIFSMATGSTPSDSNWNPACDIAGPDGKLTPDGVIDFEDLMVFAMHYGERDEDTSLSPITISDSTTFGGKTVIDGGKHTITVRFPAPLRVFITNYSVQDVNMLRNFVGIPSNVVEVAMSTADGKTYTGTADFGMIDCDEKWIYVLSGDSCCPVVYSKTVKVDTKAPYVDLKAIVGEEEDCGIECEPALGKRVIITSDAYVENEAPLCTPLCCGDDCTELAEWTITVYDTQPFIDECGECVVDDPCVSPIKVCTGTGCPVECDVFGCLSYEDWTAKTKGKEKYEIKDYCVILEANDVVGNLYKGYGILFLMSNHTATLIDAELSSGCQFIPLADGGSINIMGPCTFKETEPN
jgi:hypothetical protein